MYHSLRNIWDFHSIYFDVLFPLESFYIFTSCQMCFCRYMEHAIAPSPLTFNETNIIEAVAASEVGRYIAKDFLINNWKAVSER